MWVFKAVPPPGVTAKAVWLWAADWAAARKRLRVFVTDADRWFLVARPEWSIPRGIG